MARYLLDSNTAMNSAFIRDSAARRAIMVLRASQNTLLVDEMSWCEMLRVLQRKRRDLQLHFDPEPILRQYLNANGVIFVPPGDLGANVDAVNRSDRHLVRAAIANHAAVVSDDHPLIVEARRCRVQVLTTKAVLRKAGVNGRGKHQGPSSLGKRQSRRSVQGYVIIKFGEVNYGQKNTRHRHTLFDLPNRAWIYYDGPRAEWVAKTDDGIRLSINAGGADLYGGIACFTYKYTPDRRHQNTVRLMFGKSGGRVLQQTSRTLGNGLNLLPYSGCTIFSDRRGQNHGKGRILEFHGGAGLVSKETFQAVVSLGNLMLSLDNADILDPALKIISVDNRGRITLPVEDDLR